MVENYICCTRPILRGSCNLADRKPDLAAVDSVVGIADSKELSTGLGVCTPATIKWLVWNELAKSDCRFPTKSVDKPSGAFSQIIPWSRLDRLRFDLSSR